MGLDTAGALLISSAGTVVFFRIVLAIVKYQDVQAALKKYHKPHPPVESALMTFICSRQIKIAAALGCVALFCEVSVFEGRYVRAMSTASRYGCMVNVVRAVRRAALDRHAKVFAKKPAEVTTKDT